MQYVQPCYINSPVTGNPSKPRISTFERQGKIYEEAHWFCPDTGMFIQKGLVSVKDKEPQKEKLLTESAVDPYGASGTDTAKAQAKKWLKSGRDIYKQAEDPIGEDSYDDSDLRDVWKETEVIEKVKKIHGWKIDKQAGKWVRFDAPGGPRPVTGDEHWDIMRIEDPEKYDEYRKGPDRGYQDSGDRPDFGVMQEGLGDMVKGAKKKWDKFRASRPLADVGPRETRRRHWREDEARRKEEDDRKRQHKEEQEKIPGTKEYKQKERQEALELKRRRSGTYYTSHNTKKHWMDPDSGGHGYDESYKPGGKSLHEKHKPGFMGAWGKKLDLTDPYSRVPTPINPDRAL